MMHDTIVALAALGVAGQVLAGALILVGVAAAAGVRAPLQAVRSALWGYELWAAFVVAAIATGGSLFFSEIAHFVPCELCWFQRICMYPLSIITLLAALAGDHRVARYLLPLPIVGAGVSVYHLLVENGVVEQATDRNERLRIVDAGITVDEDEAQPAVVTVGVLSEIYSVSGRVDM